MKILVIPDVHLKPQMFKQATALMHQGIADRAVCLVLRESRFELSVALSGERL